MKLDLKLNYQSSSKRKENISRAHFSVVFNQRTPNAPLRKEGLFFFGGEQMLCKWSSRTNTKKNAVLGKQLRYQFENKPEPSRPFHCKYIHISYIFTSYLHIQESQRNPNSPGLLSDMIVMSTQNVKELLLHWSKLCMNWQRDHSWTQFWFDPVLEAVF